MDNLWSIIVILLIGVVSFLFGRSQMKKPEKPASSDLVDYTTTYSALKEKAKRDQEMKLKEVDHADKNSLRNIISDNVKRLFNGKSSDRK